MKPAASLTSTLLARKGYALPTGASFLEAATIGPYDFAHQSEGGTQINSRSSGKIPAKNLTSLTKSASLVKDTRKPVAKPPVNKTQAIKAKVLKDEKIARPAARIEKQPDNRDSACLIPCHNNPGLGLETMPDEHANSAHSPNTHNIVAMTLRLDEKQHRRLRLISVHSHKSAREIMVTALDVYLGDLEKKLNFNDCECLKQARPEDA